MSRATAQATIMQTLNEYAARVGWGHSSMEDTIRYAAMADVKRLLLTHHDPTHGDAQLKEIYKALKDSVGQPLPFELAREGMEIYLP